MIDRIISAKNKLNLNLNSIRQNQAIPAAPPTNVAKQGMFGTDAQDRNQAIAIKKERYDGIRRIYRDKISVAIAVNGIETVSKGVEDMENIIESRPQDSEAQEVAQAMTEVYSRQVLPQAQIANHQDWLRESMKHEG